MGCTTGNPNTAGYKKYTTNTCTSTSIMPKTLITTSNIYLMRVMVLRTPSCIARPDQRFSWFCSFLLCIKSFLILGKIISLCLSSNISLLLQDVLLILEIMDRSSKQSSRPLQHLDKEKLATAIGHKVVIIASYRFS